MKNFFKTLNLRSLTGTVYVVFLLFLMIMLVAFPDVYVKTTFDGIKIWAVTVLPSLLPFFFLTALLTKTDALPVICKHTDKLSKLLYNEDGLAFYVQSMSFLSGYPIGAKIVADLHESGAISDRRAEKLSIVSSTSGPLFIVGGIGVAMFSDKRVGLIILLSHYLSSVIIGVAFRKLGGDKTSAPLSKIEKSGNALYDAVYSSVISVAIVGGFVAVFYTFANILSDVHALSPLTIPLGKLIGNDLAEGFAIGIIECTTGVKAIAAFGSSPLAVALSAALVSLGGLSVWCQSAIYLKRANVRLGVFFGAKILMAAITFGLSYLFCVFF